MKVIYVYLLTFFLILCASCRQKQKAADEAAGKGETSQQETGEKPPPEGEDQTAPDNDEVKRDSLKGGPYPSLLITQSRFLPADDGSGNKTRPGPARLIILRKEGIGWKQVIVDDPDSNVFHKAMQVKGSIMTAGAMGAFLKLWSFKNGKWTAETIWNPSFGGKFDRLRDFEAGKVMPGDHPQVSIATHDQGVIAVVSNKDGKWDVMEIDRQEDTFVHEIELGDFDGDGLNEIYATPSQPNKVGVSQAGEIIRFKWNGKKFEKSVVKRFETRHVKEILVTRLKGENKPALFAAVEAELEKIAGKTRIKTPVEIVRFNFDESGQATGETVASFHDAQCRFLVAGDIDGDGKTEIIAAAMKSGLWMIRPGDSLPCTVENFDKNSSGYEHAAFLADLNEDAAPELYVAADDQQSFNRYEWNGSGFDKETIIPLGDSVITWNITAGKI